MKIFLKDKAIQMGQWLGDSANSDNSHRNYKYLIFFSFVMSILMLLVSLTVFNPRYSSNDDVAMRLLANGYLNNFVPTHHLIFISLPIGFLLKNLYLVASNIPWYSILLVSFVVVGFTHFYFLVLRSGVARVFKIIFITLLIIFNFYLTVKLSFTASAFVLGLSGLLGVACAKESTSKKVFILSSIFIVLSFYLRKSAFIGSLVLIAPIFVFQFLESRRYKRFLMVIGVAIASLLSLKTINLISYSGNQEWQDYFKYNKERAALHGTPKLKIDEHLENEVLKKINWSINDFNMFRTWFFVDRSVFSYDRVKTLHTLRKWKKSSQNFKKILKEVTKKNKYLFRLFFFCFLIVLVFAPLKTKYKIILYKAYFLAVVMFLAYFYRFPERISYSILFIGTFVLMVISLKDLRKVNYKYSLLLILVFASAYKPLVTKIIKDEHLQSLKNRRQHAKFVNKLKALKKINPNALYINWGGSLSFHRLSPFSRLKDLPKVSVLGLGWRVGSPGFNSTLKDFNVDKLELEIFKRDDIFLFANSRYTEYLKTFLKEHYGKIGSLEEVKLDAKLGKSRLFRGVLFD